MSFFTMACLLIFQFPIVLSEGHFDSIIQNITNLSNHIILSQGHGKCLAALQELKKQADN